MSEKICHSELVGRWNSALRNLSGEEQKAAFNEILQNSHGIQTIIALKNACGDDLRLAKILTGLPALKPKKREIRRVALHFYRAYNGGTERCMAHFSYVLANAGLEPVVITEEREDSLDFAFAPQTERIVLPPCPTEETHIAAIYNAIIDGKIDVWWEQFWNNENLLWTFLAAKAAGVPACLTWHDCFCGQISRGECAAKDFYPKRLFDRVFVLSKVDLAFARSFGMNAVFAPNPVERAVCEKPRKCGETPVILWLARISGEKNPQDVAPIAEKVLKKNPRAIFKIVGGNRDVRAPVRNLKRQIAKSPFRDRIEYLGYVEDAEKIRKDADVYLSTSAREGWGLALMEAKSRGIPVVAYDLPHLETMKDGTGVLKVAQRDTQGAADAILSLIECPALYEKCSREALADAQKFAEFDLGKFYKEQFDSLCDENCECPAPDNAERIMLETLLDAAEAGWKDEFSAIKNCASYKIGRAITWLPRKIRGLKSTIRHAGGYVLRKIGAKK